MSAFFAFIKKLQSRSLSQPRYDLSNSEYGQNYESINPKLSLNNLKLGYISKDSTFAYRFKKVEIQSHYELKNAKIYKNKIPNYILYKRNNADNDIVKDNPYFQNLIDNVTPYEDNNGLISDNLIQIKQIKVKIIMIIKKIIWKQIFKN